MRPIKNVIDLTVGQKVPGYGILNKFGEFEFIPSQVGSRAGTVKILIERDSFTISETKNKLTVHQRLPKKRGLELITAFMNNVNEILGVLRDYDI